MAIFTTYIIKNGMKFNAKRIKAVCWSEAEYKARMSGLCIEGKLVMEIPCDENFTPKWEQAITYTVTEEN